MEPDRLGAILLAASALAYWLGAATGLLLLLAYPLCLVALLVLLAAGPTRRGAAATLVVFAVWIGLLALSGGVTLRGGATAGAQLLPMNLDLVTLLGVPAIAACFPALAGRTRAARWLGRASLACTILVVLWVSAEAMTGRIAGGLIGPAWGAMVLGTIAVALDAWGRTARAAPAPPRSSAPLESGERG